MKELNRTGMEFETCAKTHRSLRVVAAQTDESHLPIEVHARRVESIGGFGPMDPARHHRTQELAACARPDRMSTMISARACEHRFQSGCVYGMVTMTIRKRFFPS